MAVIGVLSAAGPPPDPELLRVKIGETEPVTQYDAPVQVPVTIENLADVAVTGEVTVGGPTGGIYPLAEPVQRFELEAKGSVTTTFPVAFDRTCLSGWYPIHAFVSLTEGREERRQTVGMLETKFHDAEPWGGEEPAVADFAPKFQDDEMLAAFRAERTRVLSDFVRKTEQLRADRAFRLGSGPDSFVFVALPGRRGLLDGDFSLIGPNSELHFRGLNLRLETPASMEDGEPLAVEFFEVKAVEGGIDALHRVGIGDDFRTEIVVQIRRLEGGLKLRATSPDPIVSFSLGDAGAKPVALTGGLGFRFEDPGDWTLPADSPLLCASHVGFDFEGGVSLVQACKRPLLGVEISPSRRVARAIAPGAGWLYLAPSEKSVFDAALTYRGLGEWKSGPGVRNLAGRLWIDAPNAHFSDLVERVAELRRYGATKSALVVRNWQQHGPKSQAPDVWPPNKQLGRLMDLQIVAKICRETQIMWGLEDRYGAIDARATRFDYEAVAFGADGAPCTYPGPDLESSDAGDLIFRLRPDRVEPYLAHNLKHIRYYLTPNLFAVGGVDSGHRPFYDRDGNRHSATQTRDAWRKTMNYAQGYLGPNSAAVARGGGDWLVGAADGAGYEHHSADLHGPARRVPWFALVHHGRFPVYELPAPGGDPGAPEVLLAEVMEGRLPVSNDQNWGHGLIRKAWLMQPLADELADKAIEGVSMPEGSPERLHCRWGEDGEVWINGGADIWTVDEREIAPGGFLARSGGVETAVERRGGVICEQTVSPAGWYANARPRHWSTLRVRPRLGAVRVDSGSIAMMGVRFASEEAFPVEARLFLMLCEPGKPDRVWLEQEIDPKEPTSTWSGERLLAPVLDLSGLPWPQAEVYLIARAPNGRPLRLLAETADSGRYAGFAARLGSISPSFAEDGALTAVEVSATKPVELETLAQINPTREIVDFGWVRTNGAFRLTRTGNSLVMMPLPDTPAFEATLDLAALKLTPAQVLGILSRDAFSADWKLTSPQIADGRLTIHHDPRHFSYTLLLGEGS